MVEILTALTTPNVIFRHADALAKPCLLSTQPGVYAWYFREIPHGVPLEGCHHLGLYTLLYVGISPARPGRQTLRSRIKTHFRGNAAASTLRRSLGCLLASQLGLRLQASASGKRLTFGSGETKLSDWMEQNAFVTCCIHPEPWTVEEKIIQWLRPPLNLDGNQDHPFYAELKRIRHTCAEQAGHEGG